MTQKNSSDKFPSYFLIAIIFIGFYTIHWSKSNTLIEYKRKQTISDIVEVYWEYTSSNPVIAGSDIKLKKVLFLREDRTFVMTTGRLSIHRGNWRENGSDQILLDVKTVENPLLPNGQGGGGERKYNLEIKIKIKPKSLYEVKNKIYYYRMEDEQLKDGRYIGN